VGILRGFRAAAAGRWAVTGGAAPALAKGHGAAGLAGRREVVQSRQGGLAAAVIFEGRDMHATRSHEARRTGYPATYRFREAGIVARWIAEGASGAVIGMGGAGKSNFLRFLCTQPEALAAHWPADLAPPAVVMADLNDLPAADTATFYRVLLRAFYEGRDRLDPALEPEIAAIFRENRASTDPFVTQTALRELLFAFLARDTHVVLVLDRFDRFCETATPELTDTLRGLRDAGKGRLSYLMGMRQEVAYLDDPGILGELYEILDTHVCWIGPMAEADARHLIAEETARAPDPPAEAEVARLLDLTGGYPALLKAACHRWLDRAVVKTGDQVAVPAAVADDAGDVETWQAGLLGDPGIRFRLAEILDGLTQAELLALTEVQRLDERGERLRAQGAADAGQVERLIGKARQDLAGQHAPALARLAGRGLIAAGDEADTWRVVGTLLAAQLGGTVVRGRGTLWREPGTGELHQGQTSLEGLANLERRLLEFLLEHPRARHTKTAVIEAVWPDEAVGEGVMDDALYQVVKELRRKIEPQPSSPRYLVTWRGRPEGGYQLFPEGRPGGG